MDQSAHLGSQPQNTPKRRLQRAKLVCEDCHTRKVRCDLSSKPPGVGCSNCSAVDCIPRHRSKPKRSKAVRETTPSSPQNTPTPDHPVSLSMSIDGSSTASMTPKIGGRGLPTRSPDKVDYPQVRDGYLGGHSFMDAETHTSDSVDRVVDQSPQVISNAINQLKSLTEMPPRHIGEALIEMYFSRASFFYPIVDRKTFHPYRSSITLHNGIFLAGSQMGYATEDQESTNYSAKLFYTRTKTLLHLNVERDPMTVLKTICLMAWWSGLTSKVIALDTPWHWVGVGIKLAMQVGLHRENSYRKWKDAGCYRRIWWLLVCCDKMQTACFGRPQIIDLAETDTHFVNATDFPPEYPIHLSDLFASNVKTCLLWGRISKARSVASTGNGTGALTDDQHSGFILDLQSLIRSFPAHICLSNSEGKRNQFCLPISELHTTYFAAIVYLSLSPPRSKKTSQTEVSASASTEDLSCYLPTCRREGIIAASCAVRLFEEILVRDEVGFLNPIEAWFILLCAIALFSHLGEEQSKFRRGNNPATDRSNLDESASAESLLEVKVLRRVIKRMALKWPNAAHIEDKISQIYEHIVLASPDGSERPLATEGHKMELAPGYPTPGASEIYVDGEGMGNIAGVNEPRTRHPTEQSPAPDILLLFPFPPSFCPRMRWLDIIIWEREYSKYQQVSQVFQPSSNNSNIQGLLNEFMSGNQRGSHYMSAETTFVSDVAEGSNFQAGFGEFGQDGHSVGDYEHFNFGFLWPPSFNFDSPGPVAGYENMLD